MCNAYLIVETYKCEYFQKKKKKKNIGGGGEYDNKGCQLYS